MNIFRKVLIFIGSGLVIIGLIIAIMAFSFGGRIHNTFTGERIDIDTTYEDVESISINCRVGTLSIKEGDEFKIVAENVLKEQFESKLSDGAWTISDKKSSVFNFFDNINFNEKDSTITIYIPKDVTLKACSFELGAGKIEADLLDTESFNLKIGAGEVIVKNLVAKNTTFDCGAGSIKVDGAISGESKINCGVGQISVSLIGDPDAYNYSVKVGLGTTKINGDSYSGISDKKITNDNATGSFTLDCGIGEIDLTIKQ